MINSDWPAFATGGRLIVEDPSHLYDMDTQRRVQLEVTGGRTLVTLGINGILPFLAPAWVAFLAVPFDLLGTNLGGRLWILAGLACLALGLYLAVRPRPPTAILPAFASVPTALLLLNAQLDGFVALGIGAALALWTQPFLAGLSLGLTLLKPQLVLPLGAALLLTRQWRVLAGWALAGVVLLATSVALNPRWVLEWLPVLGGTVQPGAREVDLAHLGTLMPRAYQGWAVVVLSLVALAGVLWTRQPAPRRVPGGSRSADRRRSPGGAARAAHRPGARCGRSGSLGRGSVAGLGAAVGGRRDRCGRARLLGPRPSACWSLGWLCLRAAGLIAWRRGRAPASAG